MNDTCPLVPCMGRRVGGVTRHADTGVMVKIASRENVSIGPMARVMVCGVSVGRMDTLIGKVMREERLIERIRIREKDPARRVTEDPKKVIDSVLGYLQKILNTRRGSVLIAEDFGIPDFTDFLRAHADGLRDVEKSIRQTIEKYEPRLTNVQVEFIPQEEDVLSLSFQIVGKLAGEHRDQSVVFESQMGSDGKISIRR